MSSFPLISVVTACFNGAAFLETSVRSGLSNHPGAEVIVVDDGSEDDSLVRAAALAREYPGRMLVVSQSNGGPASARNTGIRLARGKYLCFLDVDDQYAPGFLHAAIDALERESSAVGVYCQIELINAHRTVETWQREAMELSGPCNIVMRTEIVRQIGGFPVDPAFRGESGGEDACFRRTLLQLGKVLKIEHPFFCYRMRPGGYNDLFLNRATLVDGKLQMNYLTREEQDGSVRQATARYQREVGERALGRLIDKLNASVAAAADFDEHSAPLSSIAGALSLVECHALHWLAGNWPVDGGIVVVGNVEGRAMISLADGSRVAGRGGVAAVGIQEGSQPILLDSLRRAGAADSVAIQLQEPAHAADTWQGRVRILFISADYNSTQSAAIIAAWLGRLTQFGLVILQTGPTRPEVAGAIDGLGNEASPIKEYLRIGDLIILQKI